MKFFLFFSFCMTVTHSISKNENIVFDLADLTIDFETDDQIVQIEAFKTSSNDAIIQSGDSDKYGRLTWVSVGYPKLIDFTRNSSIFNSNGFFIKVELLNGELRDKFCQMILQKYKIKVEPSQIVTLVPKSFECELNLYDQNYQMYTIRGKSLNLFKFPLYVSFEAPVKSIERELIEQRFLSDQDLEIHCEIKSRGYSSKENVFTVTGRQISNLNLIDSIFGSGDKVYVTRHQLASLSHELFMHMNVFEEYQMPEKEFSSKFVENLAIMSNFQYVPTDEALKHMSSYNIAQDLKPDQIKEELSKVLEVVSDGKTEKIKLNNDQYSKLTNSSDFSIGGGFSASIKGIPVSLNANYGSKSNNRDEKSSSKLSDTLNQINNDDKNEIEWMRKGDMIVPKSIRASKLDKVNFEKDLKFSRIKKIVSEAPFRRTFSLKVKQVALDKNSNSKLMNLRNSFRVIQSYNSLLDTIVEWSEQIRNKTAKILYEEGNFDITSDFDDKYEGMYGQNLYIKRFDQSFSQEPFIIFNFQSFTLVELPSTRIQMYPVLKIVKLAEFASKYDYHYFSTDIYLIENGKIYDDPSIQAKVNWLAIGV